MYLQWNTPAVPPRGECLSTTETFRRLAARMGLREPSLYDSDEELARQLLASDHPSLAGITLERLQEEGWVRLNYPRPLLAFADGFPTPSGKLEFYSERAAADGHDPLAGYTAPKEVTDRELAKRYPLALVAGASHFFVNTIFANKPELRRREGGLTVVLHPDDAAARGLSAGMRARVFNERGSFTAEVAVGDTVRPGVVGTTKGHWLKFVGGANVNATVEERDADMGGAPVFHDNRVEVVAADSCDERSGAGEVGEEGCDLARRRLR
jgi:anaerobic selenocysteine-containing dehydrogenase